MRHTPSSALAVLLTADLLGGCSLLNDPRLGGGIGATCATDSDCQASQCSQGICISRCQSDLDCPAPSQCITNLCQLPLKVGAALIGHPTDIEGWTAAQRDGLQQAAMALPYVTLDLHFGVAPGDAAPDLAQLVSDGAQLIIGDSVDFSKDFQSAAAQNPGVKFLWNGDNVQSIGGPNTTTYWVQNLESWYIAGKAAAQLATSLGRPRLGVISSFINPETTQNVNAFTLGALTINSKIVVEVRFLGFWYDTNTVAAYPYTFKDGTSLSLFHEEQLAAQLLSTGCAVVAHLGDTQRSVSRIDWMNMMNLTTNGTAYSFANDNVGGCQNAAAGGVYASCAGSIYENWGPLYRSLFDGFHRGTWDPRAPINYDITDDPQSVVGVALAPSAPIDTVVVSQWVHDLVATGHPRQAVFTGPFAITGQRDANNDGIPDAVQQVQAGEVVSEEEQHRMCWFVKGVVQKVNPNDPASADQDAQVSGGVPDPGPPPGASVPAGLSMSCRVNAGLVAP